MKNGNRIAGAIMTVGMLALPTYMEVNGYAVPVVPYVLYIIMATTGLILYIIGDKE